MEDSYQRNRGRFLLISGMEAELRHMIFTIMILVRGMRKRL